MCKQGAGFFPLYQQLNSQLSQMVLRRECGDRPGIDWSILVSTLFFNSSEVLLEIYPGV